MSKSSLTLEIEEKLRLKAKRKCERYAFEVPLKGGICDFVTSKIDFNNHSIPHIICYEIKVSFSDFKSENGHNFYGNENYYVMPQELFDEITKKQQNHRFVDAGVIVYKNGRFYKKTVDRTFRCKLSIEEKFKLLDTIIMRILYTGK